MDQNAKRIGLLNWAALLVTTGALFLVSRFVDSASSMMAAIVACFGFLVAILGYFQMGLEERERLERLELEEMSKAHGTGSLFETAGADTFPARRSREQFDKYFVPAFTVLLFALQAAAAYWPWKLLAKMPEIKTEKAPLGMALVGLAALCLFLLGKFSSGLARLQKQRFLRPGASYALLGAYGCFAVICSMGAALAGYPKVDLYVARVLCVISGLIALETLLGMVMEMYRVRVKGSEVRVLYESRLVGLLGQPEAIFTTAAHALDYQFGFKVSETDFYRFLQRKLPMLLLVQAGALLASTCFVIIGPGEQGLLERCGAPVAGREVMNPGLHFKLPWPVDSVQRFRTDQVQMLTVGTEPDNAEAKRNEDRQIIAWTVAHSKEDPLLVASREVESQIETGGDQNEKKAPPVSLIAVGVPIHFRIADLRSWAYVNKAPAELLNRIASRELVRFLANADLEDLMSNGRVKGAQILSERIQAAADKFRLGVQILFVGIADIHPPVKVAAHYEKVIGAMQTREAKILDAHAHDMRTNALARAEADKRVQQAEAEKQRLNMSGAARAALFTNQLQAFEAAPGVYAQREYFRTIARATSAARKYVIAATNTSDVIQLNLEDKIRPDLLDIPIPAPKK